MADKVDDPELQAIATLLSVLEPLKPPARANVLDFVFRRLGIHGEARALSLREAALGASAQAAPATLAAPAAPAAPADLRTLAEEKQPKTVIQKVALVAFYLANSAPAGERREYIVSADIKRYFKQAGFPLPTAKDSVTLVNAKNAGYLDGLQDGQYRLNPVGYNLVVHKLPSLAEKPARQKRRAKPKKGGAKRRK
jgi:hypothetical protein